MSYKLGTDKRQTALLPPCLDDYVNENHICRMIWAFIQQLDMVALGFKYAECKETGNSPYDPRMLLALYIYGYLHRVRSSRRLEAETHRNVEVMWLMDGLQPDDRTICNFRKDNATAIRAVFREFSRMCHELELYGGETIAVDGTKFRANNSRKHNHNKTTVENELSRINKTINEYLNALDKGDAAEAYEITPSEQQIHAALEKLKERKAKYDALKDRLETESEVSTVDPDARLMHSGGDARKLDVCYNVLTAVDAQHHIIVDFEVSTQSADLGNLYPMAEKSKEVMETDTLTILGDKGFYDGQDIAACEADGDTVLVAKPKAGGAVKEAGFTHDCFVYDQDSDTYRCPCNNRLQFMRMHKHSNGKQYRVYANYSACSHCPQRAACVKQKGREILRLPYQDVLDTVDERTRNNKELYRKRHEIVEHPFGTIKAIWGYKHYLCRGMLNVTAETALAYLAYNFRRFITIFNTHTGYILPTGAG